jgi:hypothetical protein
MPDERDVIFDDDNPEWTEEDFARARPASELPAPFLSAFPKTKALRRKSLRNAKGCP